MFSLLSQKKKKVSKNIFLRLEIKLHPASWVPCKSFAVLESNWLGGIYLQIPRKYTTLVSRGQLDFGRKLHMTDRWDPLPPLPRQSLPPGSTYLISRLTIVLASSPAQLQFPPVYWESTWWITWRNSSVNNPQTWSYTGDILGRWAMQPGSPACLFPGLEHECSNPQARVFTHSTHTYWATRLYKQDVTS